MIAAMQQIFGLRLVRAVDVNFRLDNRHQAGGDDLLADLELLVNDCLDALGIRLLDHRAHLGAENAVGLGFFQQLAEIRASAS